MHTAPVLFSPRNEFLDAALIDGSLQEDAPPAGEAVDAYVRPQPGYLPLVAAAGVPLLEADNITQLYFHGFCPLGGRLWGLQAVAAVV